MKLTELKIENFRSFKNQSIRLDDYTCLVGPNGSGKSVVLMALNVFFRENASTVTDVLTLSEEDFHHRNTKEPVKVTLTFENLSEEAQEDFKHYYRQGKLVLFAKAEWDGGSGSAAVKQCGSRLVMEEFADFFQAEDEGKKVAELREFYATIRTNFKDLPDAKTKPAMTSALRDYEESHRELCKLLDDPTQIYGWTKGLNRLARYIQWVYVPAVKDASSEQEESNKTALGRLLARTVRTKLDFSEAIEELKTVAEERYTQILENQKEALKELELSIEKRLQVYIDARARLNLGWHYDAKTSIAIKDPLARVNIGDAEFIGEVARAGHGMQRGFLLAVLHELVGNEEKGGPKLLLGFEEPELYQHPPQAQHLADVLERLSRPGRNAQIIVTTHSPYFVTSKGFSNIRMFRKSEKDRCSRISWTTYAKVEERLSKALGEKPKSPTGLMARVNQIMHPSQRELFFTPIAILVEGPEDVGFISTHLELSGQWETFRGLGCHFVATGGKCNMGKFVAIAEELRIDVFVVVDADGDEQRPDELEKHKKDNACILNLRRVSERDSLPKEVVWEENLVMWPTKMADRVRADFGADEWAKAENKVRQELRLHDGVRRKNKMLIAATLEELWARGHQSPSLIKLCGGILRYGEKKRIGAAEERKVVSIPAK
jgi:predicted ATP-dependent endonuclease of OLD family